MAMFTYQNKNWGKEPKPGELNRRIEIVAPVAEINESGYPEMHDEKVCETWAQVIQSGDATNDNGNALAQARSLMFVMRWREDVKAGMVVLLDGTRYEINALGYIGDRKCFLGVKAMETTVIGA